MEEKQFKLKFFTTVFFVVAAILIFWFFISLPLLKKTEKLRQDFELSRKLLLSLNQKEEHFAELEKLDSEVKNHFMTLAAIVLSEKDIFNFVVSLENLAGSSGIILTIDPPVFGQPEKNFQVLTFRLSAQGSFSNFYKFFHSLEYFDFWVNIEEVKISRLNDFTLPSGSGFKGLTTNDISAIITISAFLTK